VIFDFVPEYFRGWRCRLKPLVALLMFWIMVGECEASERDRSASLSLGEPAVFPLGLTGYNYTNREISEFFVTARAAAISPCLPRRAAAAAPFVACPMSPQQPHGP
jgi:hypothetical protein